MSELLNAPYHAEDMDTLELRQVLANMCNCAYGQGGADERRKFAEWLMKSKYIFVGRDGFTHDFHEKTVSLDEVLSEYEKEQTNERNTH